MQATVETCDLLRALRQVRGAVRRKGEHSGSDNVLIESAGKALRLTTGDGTMTLSALVAADIRRKGAMALHHASLLKYVRLLDPGPLSLAKHDGAEIKTHSATLTMPCGQEKDFAAFEPFAMATTITFGGPQLRAALSGLCQHGFGKDSVRVSATSGDSLQTGNVMVTATVTGKRGHIALTPRFASGALAGVKGEVLFRGKAANEPCVFTRPDGVTVVVMPMLVQWEAE